MSNINNLFFNCLIPFQNYNNCSCGYATLTEKQENIITNILNEVGEYQEKQRYHRIYGKSGTGKSRILCELANILSRRISLIFGNYNDILDKLYLLSDSKHDRICIIIDDFDKCTNDCCIKIFDQLRKNSNITDIIYSVSNKTKIKFNLQDSVFYKKYKISPFGLVKTFKYINTMINLSIKTDKINNNFGIICMFMIYLLSAGKLSDINKILSYLLSQSEKLNTKSMFYNLFFKYFLINFKMFWRNIFQLIFIKIIVLLFLSVLIYLGYYLYNKHYQIKYENILEEIELRQQYKYKDYNY